MQIDAMFDVTTALGECPVWDHRTGHLWWVDIDGETVWRGDPATEEAAAYPSNGRPAAVALTPDPDAVLVAREGELAWLSSGSYTQWLTLESLPGNRLNDGRVGPDGSFWVGSMQADTSLGLATGVLYRVRPDGRSTVVRTHIGVTNGLAVSPDGEWLYFADTRAGCVERYRYPPATVTGGETFLDMAGLDGRADGACTDSEGRYWLAAVHGGRLYCVTAAGEIDEIVELPVARPTRATFGGPDLDRLFVTSIGPRAGSPDGGHGLDGRLLILDVGATGTPEHVFPGAPATAR